MKSCTQCGAAASDGAVKCPACKAWLVAVGPPGTPAPAPAAQPAPPAPTASWSPNAPSAYAPAPVGAYQAPAPAYQQQAAYQGQAAYQTVAVADGDLFPSRAAAPVQAPSPAPNGSWPQSTGEWAQSPYAGQPAARKERRTLRGLPNITWDMRRAMPFIAGGCAIVVALAGLWFFVGRGHGSNAPAAKAKTAAKPKPHPTAKQRAQANRAVQNDLRNALTAEKVVYIDNGAYVASPSALRPVESSVAWGTRVHVIVGDAASRGDHQAVCLSETTRYGDTYSLGDVASGPAAGTYFGRKPCPARITAGAVARWSKTRW